jgi:CHAT domain-containing protein/tetratricopeptide (TPR) repeat protein
MRWHIIPALLACALSGLPQWLYARAGGLGSFEQAAVSSVRTTADKETPATTTERDRTRDVLQRRAEADFQEAALLQEKQTGKDLTAAARLLERSARLFESSRAQERAADAHLRAGEIYSTLSQYDKARRSFRAALKLGQDPEVHCKALSRIARTYATTGPSSLADRYSNQAMYLCERLSDNAQAEALQARGETLDFAGERSNNADYFLRARDLFALGRDDNGQAQALLMLAYGALFSSGDQEQGLEAASQALRLWSSTGNRNGVARMRSILGTLAIAKGEFETAQCNYRIARPVFREIGNKDDEGVVLNGLGFVSRETGDWRNSLQYYQNARAIFASVQDLLGELEAIQGMGKAFAAIENYKPLLPLYQAELRVAHQAGDPVAVAYALEDIATAYEAQSSYAQAEIFYRRSLEGYRAANHLHSEGDALIRLGHLQATQKKYSQAIASLERAHALKEETGQLEEIAKVQYELADIYCRLRRLKDARSAIEKTIEVIEKQRVTISHFDSRASYFASVHRYYALYVEILMLLHRQQPTLGFAERAFDASERSKVRSLLDLLTTSGQDAPCDELLQRQLKAVEATENSATDGKRIMAPSTASTLTMREVQAEIEDDHTILLEYALGDETSYLWVIDRREIRSYALPSSKKIKKLVELFRRTIQPPQWKDGETAIEYQVRARRTDQEFQVYAARLSRMLLGPVTLARTKRILVVPDGSLQYIPFAALPTPSPRVKDLLVHYQEIVILPSASVLANLRKAAAKRAPPTATAAIFADPVFEQDDPRLAAFRVRGKSSTQGRSPALNRAISDMGTSSYIARLPASRNEANAIATILRSRDPHGVHVGLDFDASREYVLKEGLMQFRLLHFATHGVVDSRHPEMSGLILSLIDRKGRKEDGYLRLGDIYKMKLSADLVVLSSCDSALGKDLDSEGIIGLPRGFLYAGARSVIATLWKVNDEATARLMANLYARIERGESPSSALRSAQLEMLHDEQWSKAYYWAAFSLQGDYR